MSAGSTTRTMPIHDLSVHALEQEIDHTIGVKAIERQIDMLTANRPVAPQIDHIFEQTLEHQIQQFEQQVDHILDHLPNGHANDPNFALGVAFGYGLSISVGTFSFAIAVTEAITETSGTGNATAAIQVIASTSQGPNGGTSIAFSEGFGIAEAFHQGPHEVNYSDGLTTAFLSGNAAAGAFVDVTADLGNSYSDYWHHMG